LNIKEPKNDNLQTLIQKIYFNKLLENSKLYKKLILNLINGLK
jgi:hypothetical protein